MKKRAFLVFGFVILALAAVMMILPLQAMAATDVSAKHHHHHVPHFFFKKGYHGPGIYASGGNLNYGGGPVMGGTVNVYAIFWEPTGNVSASYNSLIERYFNDVNGSGLYNNNTQYTDSSGDIPSNETLTATWVDTTPYLKVRCSIATSRTKCPMRKMPMDGHPATTMSSLSFWKRTRICASIVHNHSVRPMPSVRTTATSAPIPFTRRCPTRPVFPAILAQAPTMMMPIRRLT